MGWNGHGYECCIDALHERPPDGQRGRWLLSIFVGVLGRRNEGLLWLEGVYAILIYSFL